MHTRKTKIEYAPPNRYFSVGFPRARASAALPISAETVGWDRDALVF